MNCSCCGGPKNVNDLDNTFDLRGARADAAAYRRKGLARRSQRLVAFALPRLSEAATMLEIGCGAGALHQELLRNGDVKRAHGIDASSGYLTAARENAAHFAIADRVVYQQDDFALMEAVVDSAELVVLDRVICCYPNLDQLLGKAAQHTSRYLAISYPVDRWWTRLGKRVISAVLSLLGSGYHPYVHPQTAIDAITKAAGLEPIQTSRHFIWQIKTYQRSI